MEILRFAQDDILARGSQGPSWRGPQWWPRQPPCKPLPSSPIPCLLPAFRALSLIPRAIRGAGSQAGGISFSSGGWRGKWPAEWGALPVVGQGAPAGGANGHGSADCANGLSGWTSFPDSHRLQAAAPTPHIIYLPNSGSSAHIFLCNHASDSGVAHVSVRMWAMGPPYAPVCGDRAWGRGSSWPAPRRMR
jgi:hypothetical protein